MADPKKSNPITEIGQATLVAGTVTVANTSVGASSKVLLSRQTAGGTCGHLSIANVVAGTSFDIVSDNALDTSVVDYVVIETS